MAREEITLTDSPNAGRGKINRQTNELYALSARAAGLTPKESVRVASTANINLTTGGLLTVDGIVLAAGNRVLVKNQTTASENGIYVVGSAAWARTADADTSAEVVSGMAVYVEAGTANGERVFRLTTPDPITLGTTALTFAEFTDLPPLSASETQSGIAEIATQAETDAGTDDARIVTPLKAAARYATKAQATETSAGIAEIATQAETDTGTDDARIVTPAKLAGRGFERTANKNAASGYPGLSATPGIPDGTKYLRDDGTWQQVSGAGAQATETAAGIAELATQAETDAGTVDLPMVTPLKLATRLLKAIRHLVADPATPADGEAWIRSDLATPELKARIGGVTKTVGGAGGGITGYFYCYRDTVLATDVATNTWTSIPLTLVLEGPTGILNANGDIVAEKAGRLMLKGEASLASIAAGYRMMTGVLKNGTDRRICSISATAAAASWGVGGWEEFPVAAGDTLTLQVHHVDPTARNLQVAAGSSTQNLIKGYFLPE